MRELVEKAMGRYGTEVILCRKGEEKRLRAFFQPSNSKARQNMEQSFSPLGEIPRGQYVYIGPAEPQVQPEDTLLVGGSAYLVRRIEQIRDRRGVVYLWGLCQEKGRDDTWGSQV